MRTIRRDATHGAQPAQRRLRAWRDCRAPVPSVFPSEASPDGKTEVICKPGSEESVRTGWLGTPAVPGRTCSPRPQARSPRAFETIGIHLNIALGLSNEVGPPHLIIIENPEAHIHPAGQTSLAELAARASAGGSQVILETHSDHVLNGVRLAVAEGILTSDQVVIHYFERDGLDVRMTSPVLTDSGRLDVWPEGFFDQHERNLSRLISVPLAPFNGS